MLSLQQKYDLLEEENKINGLFFKELQMIFADRDEKLLELGRVRSEEDYNAFMKSTRKSTNNRDNFSFGENANYSKQLYNAMLPIGMKINSDPNIEHKKRDNGISSNLVAVSGNNVHVTKQFYQKLQKQHIGFNFDSDKRTFLDQLDRPGSGFSPRNIPSRNINLCTSNTIPVDTVQQKIKRTIPIEESNGRQSAFKKIKLD